MYALISDVHANLAALRAVLDHAERLGAKRVACLGDVVGYGPDPVECVTLVRERCDFCLKGNHDVAVLHDPLGFNQAARNAAIWTKRRLKPGWFAARATRANWKFLADLPERHEEAGRLFVHGSPRDPVMEYIEECDLMDMGFGPGDKILEIFKLLSGPCFVGHTHRPGVIDNAYRFHKPAAIDMRWPLGEEPCIVNVGSVGQPRDGDPRACYVTVDQEGVSYHRVQYDVEATASRIHAQSALHDILAERLREGR